MNKKSILALVISVILIIASVGYILLTQVFDLGLDLKKKNEEQQKEIDEIIETSVSETVEQSPQFSYLEYSGLRYTDMVSQYNSSVNAITTFTPENSLTTFLPGEKGRKVNKIVLTVGFRGTAQTTLFSFISVYCPLVNGNQVYFSLSELTPFETVVSGEKIREIEITGVGVVNGITSISFNSSASYGNTNISLKSVQLFYTNVFKVSNNVTSGIETLIPSLDSVGGNLLINVPKAPTFTIDNKYSYTNVFRTNLNKVTETENEYVYEVTKADFEHSYFIYDYILKENLRPKISYNVESYGSVTTELICGYDELTDSCYYIIDLEIPEGYKLERIFSNLTVEELTDIRYKVTCDNTMTGGFVNVKYVLKTAEDDEPDNPVVEDSNFWESREIWQQAIIIGVPVIVVFFLILVLKGSKK